MGRMIGYARVSTASQTTAPQVAELKAAGCDRIFHEKVSSRVPEEKRIQLQASLAVLEAGDCWTISKLDRAGRSMVEVINRLHDLQSRGIYVRTLDGLLDTRALGKMAPLVIGLLTGLAEVEREMIRERTQESVDHRRRTGGDLGGRPGLEQVKKENILKLRDEGHSLRKIRTLTGVSLSAVQRTCKESERLDAMPEGDVGYEIHNRAVELNKGALKPYE